MTTFKKMSAIALTSLTLAVAAAPSAEAGWHGRRHGGAVAAGLIGGALLGAAYAGSAYGHGYGYGYARPVYAGPSYEEGCYRRMVGRNYYGRPIIRTICY